MKMKNKIKTKMKPADYLNPEMVIEQLDIKEKDKVTDLGCGRGFFVIPVAKKVGEEGKVYAIDILKSPLEAVSSAAKLNFLNNIIIGRADIETRGDVQKIMQGELMNVVMISNVMFSNQRRDNIIAEAGSVLKQTKELAIIDWANSKLSIAPPAELLADPEKIVELCAKNGLTFKKDLDVGGYHWGKVFIKE